MQPYPGINPYSMPLTPLLYLFGLLLLSVMPASAQTSSDQNQRIEGNARFIKWAWQDAPALLGQINGRTVLWGTSSLAVISGLSLLDESIRDRAQKEQAGLIQTYTDAANYIAEPYIAIPATLGLFGASLLTNDLKFQDAAFTSLQSLAYASGATFFLKMVIGRHRPRDTASAYEFAPFSGNQSFPSGHTTATFAMLVPWAMYYPGPVTWGIVAVSGTGTALARILQNKHWLSDVVGGATIGIVSGVLLSRRHQRMQSGHTSHLSYSFSPTLSPNQSGFSFTVQF